MFGVYTLSYIGVWVPYKPEVGGSPGARSARGVTHPAVALVTKTTHCAIGSSEHCMATV